MPEEFARAHNSNGCSVDSKSQRLGFAELDADGIDDCGATSAVEKRCLSRELLRRRVVEVDHIHDRVAGASQLLRVDLQQ